MIRDSLAMQIPIGIVSSQLSGQYEDEVCVAGLPHILSTYPDGRMDIYITGTIKCKITELESDDLYKVYYYRELSENLSGDDSLSLEIESFKTLLERWAVHFLPDPVQRETFSNTLHDVELMINYCAVFLVDEYSVRKTVMEAETLRKKIRLLMEMIGPKEISLGPFMPTLKF